MDAEPIFRASVAAVSLVLVFIRAYYGWQARRSRARALVQRTGALLRAGIWATGLLAATASVAYVLAPQTVIWASLALPIGLRVTGIALGIATCLLFYWIHRALGRNWAMPAVIQAGQTLVTSGPYRWIRHPMYSLLFVWSIAYFFMSGNVLIGAAWLSLGLAAVWATGPEETTLTEHFGDSYRAYAGRTGRFIPRLT